MSKIIVLLVGLFMLQNVIATEITPTVEQLHIDFRAVSKDADVADKAGKFIDASNLYLQYCEIGKGLKRDDLIAWGYNNAGYELIKEYNSNRSSPTAIATLKTAKGYIEKSLAIKGAVADCKEKATKNMKAIDYQLSVFEKIK
jgi:hypothetical protein